MAHTEILRGPRLYLRPLSVSDVGPSYLAWLHDPEVTRYLEVRFAEHTHESLVGYVDSVVSDPTTYLYAIILRDNGKHVGNIKLGPVDPRHRRAEIGIMLGDRLSWGHGYATEAIRLICDYGFHQLGLHKVTAGAYASNEASVKAFARAGFVVEGRTSEHFADEGGWVDGVLMGRLQPTETNDSEG